MSSKTPSTAATLTEMRAAQTRDGHVIIHNGRPAHNSPPNIAVYCASFSRFVSLQARQTFDTPDGVWLAGAEKVMNAASDFYVDEKHRREFMTNVLNNVFNREWGELVVGNARTDLLQLLRRQDSDIYETGRGFFDSFGEVKNEECNNTSEALYQVIRSYGSSYGSSPEVR